MTDILHEMLKHYGLKEVFGKESNPEILAMFTELGYDWVDDDSTTAWCSAALNYFCKKLGYERSGELTARSWLKIDKPIIVLKPSLGDIVVLWAGSPDSWRGHVGLYITEDKDSIYILGGNQNNQIKISPYPRERLLGYRKVRKLEPT